VGFTPRHSRADIGPRLLLHALFHAQNEIAPSASFAGALFRPDGRAAVESTAAGHFIA
jgi:hypothetical protein